ncbi:MAG TPA: LPS export ABC transporter periplasmic protein LptC [Pyrinomonadaceae bacterium]
MQEIKRRRAIAVGLRARLPLVARVVALFILVAGIVFVALQYNRLRKNEPFRMRGETPELSTTVTSVVEGYERRVTEGDRLRLYVKAARDITYSDGHHELEEVHLEMYPLAGVKPDQITAHRAVYLPEATEQNKAQAAVNAGSGGTASTTAKIIFTGDVNIETRDALKVKTEKLTYDQKTEMGETNDPVSFVRQNVSGHATGVLLDAKNKKLEMKNEVEITVTPEVSEKSPAKTGARGQPITIRSAHASFDQLALHLIFTGGATAEQGQDVMSGETLSGTLNAQKKLQKLESRGNAYLRSMSEGKGGAEVHSADMDFFFNAEQQLEHAIASRDVQARSLEADSQMELTGATALDVNFQKQNDRSLLKEMRADGRSVMKLSAPKSRESDPRAASKQLTADGVKLFWRPTGRDLERAEAVGNAELIVDPVQKNAASDRKVLTAPRFDCDFYEMNNLAKTFTASGGESKVTIEPHQPTADRATRTLTAQKIAAVFVRETQDVERLDATGDAKFVEQDRNGRAVNASYTAADEVVRLRGGEPVVWDSRARTKAVEIDTDTRNDTSFTRGKTATTYYSQEQTNGATPFSKVKSPVFIISDNAEFRHLTGVAIYTGGARAWQDDNFVKADRLTIYRENKRMEGDGHVQSVLYQARNKKSAEVVPALATSDRMFYSDVDRLLHYEGTVDIKQGTDRIQSAVADVYLLKETSEVEKTIAQRDVVVTQPGRQGNGDWAQYTAADETVVLKGNPARVVDADKGTQEGGRLTVYLREDRVVADDARGPQSPGRTRSTHKIRKQ